MPSELDALRHELAVANRILAHEGILDAFGHVSMRHPGDPTRFFLSRSRAPELVEPPDILEYSLDAEPVRPTEVRLYAERVIHGCIYQARQDVHAVVHHHAPALMPYCISGETPVAVFHLGATMGAAAPFWDSREEFGDTNLLVSTAEQGRSLARALGPHFIVLMRRHGATVAGADVREAVFRSIYSARNAEYQTQARLLGRESPLSAGEIELAAALNLLPGVVARAWEYWVMRLKKRGELPPSGRRQATPTRTSRRVRRAGRISPSQKAKGRKR